MPIKPTIPLLLGLLGLAAPALQAQDSTRVVTGRVVDERTGQPIRMAAIYLGPRVADSDSAGVFRLCHLAPGAATLRVRARGYEERVVPVTVGEQDSTTVLVRTPPSAPGAPAVIHIGHRPSPDSHRAIILVDGERAFHDPSGCGVPRPGERRLDSVSPGEIESVELLKGPAAVERFGPAAEYGIILITMKKASAGRTP